MQKKVPFQKEIELVYLDPSRHAIAGQKLPRRRWRRKSLQIYRSDESGGGWRRPPPPPWEKAVSSCHANASPVLSEFSPSSNVSFFVSLSRSNNKEKKENESVSYVQLPNYGF